MKGSGRWLAALCLVWLMIAWAVPAVAAVPPGYEPEVNLLNPEEFRDNSTNGSGKSAVMEGGTHTRPARSGGFWSWLADHGMGLVKGIGAGLIGAAMVVGVTALVVGRRPSPAL